MYNAPVQGAGSVIALLVRGWWWTFAHIAAVGASIPSAGPLVANGLSGERGNQSQLQRVWRATKENTSSCGEA